MKLLEYGDQTAETVLLQAVDDHDMEYIKEQVRLIGEMTDVPFCLRAVKVGSWNRDLSPWEAPAVFGSEGFRGGAPDFLEAFIDITGAGEAGRRYIIGGYSLSGLFALWAACEKEIFTGAAAASPSMWFPGFVDYLKEHDIHAGSVYLSLGDKEEKTGNRVMQTVGDCMRQAHEIVKEQGIETVLEWNKGNHFKDVPIRTARAYAWVLDNLKP